MLHMLNTPSCCMLQGDSTLERLSGASTNSCSWTANAYSPQPFESGVNNEPDVSQQQQLSAHALLAQHAQQQLQQLQPRPVPPSATIAVTSTTDPMQAAGLVNLTLAQPDAPDSFVLAAKAGPSGTTGVSRVCVCARARACVLYLGKGVYTDVQLLRDMHSTSLFILPRRPGGTGRGPQDRGRSPPHPPLHSRHQ